MKKILFSLIVFLAAITPANSGIVEELAYITGHNDFHMYIDVESMIKFLKNKGVHIKELDELLFDGSVNRNNKVINDFRLKLSDIKEILLAGNTENFKEKKGFILLISLQEGQGAIPDSIKNNPVSIQGITLYQAEKDEDIFFTLTNNSFIIGDRSSIETYLGNRRLQKKALTEFGRFFSDNTSGKMFYLKLDVSQYLKDAMEKALQQGAAMSKGLNENVFLKSLINLKAVEYGVLFKDRIGFFAGMQGINAEDSERYLMLSHFVIVGSSFAASFADMIAARSRDETLEKVTSNSEVITSVQHILGRMTTAKVNNGVIVSFYLTEQETASLVSMINKGIADEKQKRAELKESEKISEITKAIKDKNTVMAELLLKEKLNINRKDLDGETVLSTAALMGDIKIASIALKTGALIDQKTEEGMTPLHYASTGGDEKMVSFLLQKGADVKIKDSNDFTALHFNAGQGNALVTKLLVNAGVELNAVSVDGYAPVHLACEKGYIDIIKVLAEKNADFNLKDGNWQRGVDIAAKNGHTAIVEYFKEKYNLEPEPVQQDDDLYDNEFNDGDDEESVEDDYNADE